ncbi:hypothetical protein C8Q77DRAFT_1133104 [Trametes polyzona]|nr:hypothetical protein C8Q77DRAFT_1133104 [Trametes polyzona]
MASPGPGAPSPAQIIEVVQSSYTITSVELPVPTFLVYDYLLTLDQELKLFWRRKFTGASALFFFIRYSTLLCYAVLGTIGFTQLPDTSCNLLTKAQAAFTMFQYIPWAAFSGLRVLALSGMNWPLATVVFLLSTVPAGINFSQYGLGLRAVNVPFAGCVSQTFASPKQLETFIIVSRGSLILADFIGVVVTVLATRRKANAPQLETKARSLRHVLFYDGVSYFCALLCFSILNFTLSLIAIVTPHQAGSYVTALTDPLTAVLVCRFLLDLQAANVASLEPGSVLHEGDTIPGHEGGGGGTLVFARVIGSMGASLKPDNDGIDTDDGSDTMSLDEMNSRREVVHVDGASELLKERKPFDVEGTATS